MKEIILGNLKDLLALSVSVINLILAFNELHKRLKLKTKKQKKRSPKRSSK